MSLVVTCLQSLLLFIESLVLVDGVIELGECVGDLPSVDIGFESSSDPGILGVALGER